MASQTTAEETCIWIRRLISLPISRGCRRNLIFPGIDSTSFAESRRKDLEAPTGTNRLAYEAIQALVKKQTELLNANVMAIQEAAQHIHGADPTEVLVKQG
ncbi:phasin family protein [Caballeronia sp.]|uniref:phasin family protein n=1 Tax=Caballeronia sp. TaxID=1931223 RepID=UPI003C58451F